MTAQPGSAMESRPTDSVRRGFITRHEHFSRTGSTNDVIRAWLAEGTPEVCLAVADEQSAGRGREGRTWLAPPRAGLLLSLGFRPTWLPPDRVWQLAATASLAMADAAEVLAGLPHESIRLKWPNDLVVVDAGPHDPRTGALRKLAGVLGETDGLGTIDPRVVVGLGVNVGWPATTFPAELAASMTSLDEASGGRSPSPAALLEGFVARLEPAVHALRQGRFDGDTWQARQATTDRLVVLEFPDGSSALVRATGVDVTSGALVVLDRALFGGSRRIVSGEVHHVRPVDRGQDV